MWPTSATFQAAVATSHKATFRVETIFNGTVTGTYDEAVLAGGVSESRDSPVRTSFRATLFDADGTLGPRLDVYGHEVRLWRGIDLDGGPEYVPMGTFGITDSRNPRCDGFSWEVQGYDRAAVIQQQEFYEAYVIASGTNYGSAIQALIRLKLPAATFVPALFSDLTTALTPLLTFEVQANPWDAALSMARSIGMELFFDPMGTCVMQAEPDPADAQVQRTYAEAGREIEGHPLINLDVARSNRNTSNGVVTTGESTSLTAPVRGSAWDTDPGSPTYRFGAFGERPSFAFNPLMTTSGQCDDASAAELRSHLGATEELVFEVLCDPALSTSDVCRFVFGTVDGIYVVDTLEKPLTVESPMTGVCRTRRMAS